jgi:hypothetical protein
MPILSPEEVVQAQKTAEQELQLMAGRDPEAVRLVANWLKRNFMSTGYTDLCRKLRKYAD